MKTPYIVSKNVLALIAAFFMCSIAYAQTVSKPKDIAVFNLSYYDSTIPSALVKAIDREVLFSVSSFKRLNVIGIDKRLMHNDLNAFYRAIQESREVNVIVSDEVLMGHEAFTREDWNKAVNAYYILTSTVEDYDIQMINTEQSDGRVLTEYEVEVSVLFSVYSVQQRQKQAEFVITEKEKAKKVDQSFKYIARGIGLRLEQRLREIKDFRITTGVIGVDRPHVYFELGSAIGVYKGDEYAIIGYDKYNKPIETGLVVVTDTRQDFSTALTLYATPDVVIGDQLTEVPRLPVEFRTYCQFEGGTSYYATNTNIVVPILTGGLHISWIRGLYRFRPCLSLELNGFLPDGSNWYPVFSGLFGAEIMNTYIGRLQIIPTLQFFYTAASSKEKDVAARTLELGGKLFAHFSWLFGRDFKIGCDIGIKSGYTTNPQMPFMMRGIVGLGFTVKL